MNIKEYLLRTLQEPFEERLDKDTPMFSNGRPTAEVMMMNVSLIL